MSSELAVVQLRSKTATVIVLSWGVLRHRGASSFVKRNGHNDKLMFRTHHELVMAAVEVLFTMNWPTMFDDRDDPVAPPDLRLSSKVDYDESSGFDGVLWAMWRETTRMEGLAAAAFDAMIRLKWRAVSPLNLGDRRYEELHTEDYFPFFAKDSWARDDLAAISEALTAGWEGLKALVRVVPRESPLTVAMEWFLKGFQAADPLEAFLSLWRSLEVLYEGNLRQTLDGVRFYLGDKVGNLLRGPDLDAFIDDLARKRPPDKLLWLFELYGLNLSREDAEKWYALRNKIAHGDASFRDMHSTWESAVDLRLKIRNLAARICERLFSLKLPDRASLAALSSYRDVVEFSILRGSEYRRFIYDSL